MQHLRYFYILVFQIDAKTISYGVAGIISKRTGDIIAEVVISTKEKGGGGS